MRLGTLLLLSLAVRLGSGSSNDRPIWGVLTQPTSGLDIEPFGTSYLNADYVKFLESAGARVVPFHYEDTCLAKALFNSINGVLYPGGADILNHTEYFASAKNIWDMAISANKAGDYFPIHGTCLGFELEAVLLYNGSVDILQHSDASNISLTLVFNEAYPPNVSRMMRAMTAPQIQALQSQNLSENYHHWSVHCDKFSAGSPLSDFMNLIATSFDRHGQCFVAQWEAKNFPFYGVQYHPERSLFEWDRYEDINHSPITIEIMEKIGEFIVDESRKSFHQFPDSQSEEDALIFNYAPLFTARLVGDDEQMYFFNYSTLSNDYPAYRRLRERFNCV